MKTTTYRNVFNEKIEVEYDETAPCIICGLPVESASVGGTVICPACDCGVYRDGTKMLYKELMDKNLLKKKAEEISKRIAEDMRKATDKIEKS